MEKSLYSVEGVILRDWLKQQRLASGLTMRDLGKQLDVPFQFVAKVESGERRLDVIEYIVYCRALQCDPHIGIAEVKRSLGT